MDTQSPRKVYSLTTEGQTVLNFTEGSLNLIFRTMTSESKVKIESANVNLTDTSLYKRDDLIQT